MTPNLLQFSCPLGSVHDLLNTADIAILYISGAIGFTCGRVDKVDPVREGTLPVAFVGKSCTTYTLAHELGHLFGVHHDTSISFSFDTYGRGYAIPNTNYRTIMRYAAPSLILTWLIEADLFQNISL